MLCAETFEGLEFIVRMVGIYLGIAKAHIGCESEIGGRREREICDPSDERDYQADRKGPSEEGPPVRRSGPGTEKFKEAA